MEQMLREEGRIRPVVAGRPHPHATRRCAPDAGVGGRQQKRR